FKESHGFRLGNGAEFVVVGDFNGDGLPDLAGASQFTSGATVLLNRGDGTFRAPLLFATEDAPSGGAVGAVNGDGWLDLALTNFLSPARDVAIYFGRGDGTFTGPLRVVVGDLPLGIVAQDLNDDGKADLVVANAGSASVSVLLGRDNGTF